MFCANMVQGSIASIREFLYSGAYQAVVGVGCLGAGESVQIRGNMEPRKFGLSSIPDVRRQKKCSHHVAVTL